MSDGSKISWTDASWNPVTGCSHVSPGCQNCYAEALSLRFGFSKKPWTAPNAAENVVLHPERLEQPLRWRKPRRVFVNSMSDLFHERVPFEVIGAVFAVMAARPDHTFQVLTKRPERMREWFLWAEAGPNHPLEIVEVCVLNYVEACHLVDERTLWPLPNVWLGVSVEDQRRADERIPVLLQTPAAVRFLSCEPLLERLDLARLALGNGDTGDCLNHVATDIWTGAGNQSRNWGRVDWVIAGGESGPGYRPCDLDWLRSLRDQCAAAGVAFFCKQPAGPRSEMPLPDDLQVREFPQ